MATEEEIRDIVEEVLRRLRERLGAGGRAGTLIVVFTGATVGLREAMAQIRLLLADGFRAQLLFSEAGEHLLASRVQEELGMLPGVSLLGPETWLSALKEARAVVVPMLSVNSLARLSFLMADNPAGNVLLHALFMGKPLVLARDGVDPDGKGREALGFHRGNAALNQALRDRLGTVTRYGGILIPTDRIAETVRGLREDAPGPARRFSIPSGPIATAGDVHQAHRSGVGLRVGPGTRITPLARDLAGQLGVPIVTGEIP